MCSSLEPLHHVQFLERAAVEDMNTSQLAEGSIITEVDWMRARVTLSLSGLEHPWTGCIPLFLPLRKQKRGNTAAEQSYQPNHLTLSQCVREHVLRTIASHLRCAVFIGAGVVQ